MSLFVVMSTRTAAAAPVTRLPLKAHVTHSEQRTHKPSTILKGGVEKGHTETDGQRVVAPKPSGIMPENAPGAARLKMRIVTATRARARMLMQAGQFDEAERIVRCGIAAFPNNNPLVADLQEIRLARATDNVYSEDLSTMVDRVEGALTPDDVGCCGASRAHAARRDLQMQDVMGPVAGF